MSFTRSSVYSQDPSTVQSPTSSLDRNPITEPPTTSTPDLTSTPNVPSSPPPTSIQDPTPPNPLLLTPTLASEIISKSLDLNAALMDPSHKLHHVSWAIEPLRDAISLAFDPLGIHVDARENETEEEKRKRADQEESKRMGLAVEVETREPVEEEGKTQVGGFQVARGPQMGSEMWGDFMGEWPAHESGGSE